ncbi:MAG: hypothetical protein ACKVZ6_04640 [Kineosporiaceae bacterium]|jgi:hypothetical protein
MRTVVQTAYRHSCDHGFCTVCGGVWPCARAEGAIAAPAIPVPRLAAVHTAL